MRNVDRMRVARRCAEGMQARQVVILAFTGRGRFEVVSYGATEAECRSVARVCDELAGMLESGRLDGPRPIALADGGDRC